MAYFAKVEDNVVVNVIVAEKFFIDSGLVGDPNSWIETSLHTTSNVHYGDNGEPDGGIPLRGNYATVGCTYDPIHDVFYPQKIYNSWIINQTTWTWEAPISKPDDGKQYRWDEEIGNWIVYT